MRAGIRIIRKRYRYDFEPPEAGGSIGASIAFSSEMNAGSRKENASNKKLEPGFDSIRIALTISLNRP
jgi:hypothetical protein